MIINLTQHAATPEQIAQGVINPSDEDKAAIAELLTFEEIPTSRDMALAALSLAAIAETYGVKKAMIGGAPFFMSTLEKALKSRKIMPVYAFSKRESAEESQPDGSVRKINVFKHVGFVEGV
jgi:hypothetical protein